MFAVTIDANRSDFANKIAKGFPSMVFMAFSSKIYRKFAWRVLCYRVFPFAPPLCICQLWSGFHWTKEKVTWRGDSFTQCGLGVTRSAADVVPPSVVGGHQLNAVLFLPVVGVGAAPESVADGLAGARPNKLSFNGKVVGANPDSFVNWLAVIPGLKALKHFSFL